MQQVDLHVTKYHLVDHGHHIRNWLAKRDLPSNWQEELPEIGFIAFERDEAISAGFLRRVEGNNGMVDGLITNPTSSSILRHHGIDLVVSELIEKSKDLGIKHLFAYTKDAGTLERSEKFGFKKLPHALIALNC